jgi:uracil-DNA glycosylase family 4
MNQDPLSAAVDPDLLAGVDHLIQYVESLKAAGVTHLDVSAETLGALSKPITHRPKSTARNPQFLEELRQRAMGCAKCRELAETRTQVVFGVGNARAEILFIGEAPGADEDAQGKPFVGRAGQLLTKIIKAMGYEREHVYIANVLKCRPPNNRSPTPQEIENCLPYLVAQIDIMRPKVIVALGAVAVQALLGIKLGITKLRGHWYEYKGVPLMPTYHPAYLLRNQSLAVKREVWEDMLQVLEKLGRPISARQRDYFRSPPP